VNDMGLIICARHSLSNHASDWPLLLLDGVTLTPHIAGASARTAQYAAQVLAEDVNYITGKPLNNLCGA
jgi:D-3-phosphoglycerate dehydrogenase